MRSGTVMDIPLDQEQPDESKSYLIQFDDSSTVCIPLSLMPSLVPKPPSNVDNTGSTDSLLPPFLQINQKITYEHQGQYWKGCLGKSEGRYCFVYKRHPYSKNEEWGVNLHNLPITWVDLIRDGVFQPGHLASSFFRSAASNTTTFHPVVNLVSTINLH